MQLISRVSENDEIWMNKWKENVSTPFALDAEIDHRMENKSRSFVKGIIKDCQYKRERKKFQIRWSFTDIYRQAHRFILFSSVPDAAHSVSSYFLFSQDSR